MGWPPEAEFGEIQRRELRRGEVWRGAAGRWVRRGERGSAVVEFVFGGVLLLVPLLYVVIAVFEVQRNAFAVTEAARDAGRAYVSADDPSTAAERATYAVRLALEDQGLTGPAELHWGPIGHGCTGPTLTVDSTVNPPLDPGSRFELCVRRTYRLPGVPTMFDAGRNVVEARFVVRIAGTA
ncbi:hypothetical protein [Cryptosporangium phraense]|uniref:hypothetical protein n=1 Tax=Cryptosporangium phraense TaxID=2593070 RepID=UPI001478FCEF|nr:hypothetical protein [Cryptosporangium phraense]